MGDSPNGPSAVEVYRLVERVLNNKPSYRALLRAQGDEAQVALDLMQKVLDIRETSRTLKRTTLHAIIRLSAKSGKFPQSLILKGVAFIGDQPATCGGFADIWKGSYKNISVCLKCTRVAQKGDYDRLKKEFTREGLVWSQLSHPNLLPFYGIYPSEDGYPRIGLVSPWQENGNVSEYLEANPDAPRLPLIFDVLEGLQFLHEHHVVHQDLKSPNVLITSAGSACLADFGLSSVIEDTILRWTTLQTTAQTGGTTRYQAPELLEGLEDGSIPKATFASDIYSLASVMYEIFTGEMPFYELPREGMVVMKIVKGVIPTKPKLDLELELTEETWTLMENCWHREPEKRLTITEVTQRLHRIPQTDLTIRRVADQKQRGSVKLDPTPQIVRMAAEQPVFNTTEADLLARCNAENRPPPSNKQEHLGERRTVSMDAYQAIVHMSSHPSPSGSYPTAKTLVQYQSIDPSDLSHKKGETFEILVSTAHVGVVRAASLSFDDPDALSISENSRSPDPFVDRAQVWQDFAANNEKYPDQLSVQKGEMLDIAYRFGPSWLARKCDGTVGLVRFNFLFLTECTAGGQSSVIAYPSKAQALRDYTGTDPSELSFHKGEILEILVADTQVWWLARRMNGRVGFIRSNFLSFTDPTTGANFSGAGTYAQQTLEADLFIDKAQVWQVLESNEKYPDQLVINKNEILDVGFRGGEWWLARKLDGTVGLVRHNTVFIVDITNGPHSSVTYPSRAQALRDYVAENSSDLSYVLGEVLDILVSQTHVWWLAKKASGAIGYVRSTSFSFTSSQTGSNIAPGALKQSLQLTIYNNKDVFVDRARVLQAFNADKEKYPDQLSIGKNEMVDIAFRTGPTWLARKEDGTIGIVAFSHVVLVRCVAAIQPIKSCPFIVKALNDYLAKDIREVSFVKGEVLGIIDKTTKECWLAKRQNGSFGFVFSTQVIEIS